MQIATARLFSGIFSRFSDVAWNEFQRVGIDRGKSQTDRDINHSEKVKI